MRSPSLPPWVITTSTKSPGVTKPPTADWASTLIAMARVFSPRVWAMVTFSPQSLTRASVMSSPCAMARRPRRGSPPAAGRSSVESVNTPAGTASTGQSMVVTRCGSMGWPNGMSRAATMTVTVAIWLPAAATAWVSR